MWLSSTARGIGKRRWRACVTRATLIVVHDTHNEGYLPGMEDLLNSFAHRFDYTRMTPVTTVVSNRYDVKELFSGI